ncbi:MAG: T9SS type A sorting domain-containing protein [Fibrobacteres bacterium]|nr:T9SS type A sorting domain-containing protein [Fibrobacterota bacterium]
MAAKIVIALLFLTVSIFTAPSQYQIKKMSPDFVFTLDGDAKEWNESYFIDSLHSDNNVFVRSAEVPLWTPSRFQCKLYLCHTGPNSDSGWIYGAIKVIRDTNYIVRISGFAGDADNMKLNLGGQAQAFYIPSDGAAPFPNPSCPFQTNISMNAKCKTYANTIDSLPGYEFRLRKDVLKCSDTNTSFRFSFGTEDVSVVNGLKVYIFAGIGVENTGNKSFSSSAWDQISYYPTFTVSSTQGNSKETYKNHSIASFAISAYPNPFLPNTNISYTTDEDGTIKIFDSLGRLIKSERVNAGSGKVFFNGSALPSGIYCAQLESSKKTASIKLFLAR